MLNLLYEAKNILLLSIKPRFVDMLLKGNKTTELRRVKPRVDKGDVVLIYETSPTMALVGYGIVESVISNKPNKLWETVKNYSGITKSEFNDYYMGAGLGYAINFKDVYKLQTPVSLHLLKTKFEKFHPPQSYRYLCPIQASEICFAS